MKQRTGFTIIEVSLFLAISGFLIIGLMAGVSTSLARQRYNDSVQDFAEFMRRTYSEVVNVQSTGQGNSVTQAIYGKLVVFGKNDASTIYTYSIIGDVDVDTSTISTKEAFESANLRIQPDSESTYRPQWDSKIETTKKDNLFVGTVLIARSPVSGTIHTFVNTSRSIINSNNPDLNEIITGANSSDTATALCVGSDDIFAVDGRRRNIVLAADGHNSSAVQLIPLDSGDNQCEK